MPPVNFNIPQAAQSLAVGEKVIEVPIEDLFNLAKDDIMREGRRSVDKLSRATEYLKSGQPVNLSEISLKGGKAVIDDGFHRLRAAQALGMKSAPIRVPLAQAGKLQGMLGKLSGAAKGAVGGVTALLDPMWGLIQNTPEGQEFLRNSPMSQYAKPQVYQSGGPVPSNTSGSKIRVPAKLLAQNFARGGQIPPSGGIVQGGSPVPGRPQPQGKMKQPLQLPRFGGQQQQAQGQLAPVAQPQNVVGNTFQAANQIAADPTQVNRTAGLLENFQPGIQADTSAMLNTAQDLKGFNPLAGAAGNTLQGFIQSGNAVDVNPMVEAAQIRAQQGFGDFMGQTNESMGALGLGSSSARTAAMAREAARLQGGIAATGLDAGVAAQEAARQRQLQAFNPLLQGSGQQLSGLQSAGSLQGQASGLNLQGQTSNAGMRLSGLQSAGGLRSDVMGANLQGQTARAGQLNQLSGTLVPPTVSVNQQPGIGPGNFGSPTPKKPLFGFGTTAGGFQSGGRVDLGDFLGNLTFGQTFTRPAAQPMDSYYSRPSSRGYAAPSRQTSRPSEKVEQPRHIGTFNPSREMWAAANSPTYYGAGIGGSMGLGDIKRQTALQFMGAGGQGGGATRLSFEGTERRPGMIDRNLLNEQKQKESDIDLNQRKAIMEFFISQGINPATGQRFEHGGVVPGPSVPPDQVPIMAQGGEGVIPVKLMHRLENAKQTKQLAAVAREIQQLMGKEPELNDRDIQRKARGGKIAKVMGEFKSGTLKSSDGKAVSDRKQAIAIALDMARREGAEIPKMAQGGQIDSRPSFWEYLKGFSSGVTPESIKEEQRQAARSRFQDLIGQVEQSLPFRLGAQPTPNPNAMGMPQMGLPEQIPELPGQPADPLAISVGTPEAAARAIRPEPIMTRQDGSRVQGADRVSFMGRSEGDVERTKREYEEARGKSALLRRLAIESPRGAIAKMAPLIGAAEAQEADAFERLRLAEDMGMRQAESQANREHQANESALTRGTQERVAQMGIEAARVRGVEAAAAKQDPFAMMGAGGGSLAGLVDLQDPREMNTALQSMDFSMMAPTPENRQQALMILQRLQDMGATPADIRNLYPGLVALTGLN